MKAIEHSRTTVTRQATNGQARSPITCTPNRKSTHKLHPLSSAPASTALGILKESKGSLRILKAAFLFTPTHN